MSFTPADRLAVYDILEHFVGLHYELQDDDPFDELFADDLEE